MAKVKIQGHASGTGVLTVTAPNTSTDRTITLPDSTGTLLSSEGAVTINDSGADVDFRVESDNDANALFVQGSDGNVGIGISTPTNPLTVEGDGARIAFSNTATYPCLGGISAFRSGTSHGNMYIETAGGSNFNTPVERMAIEGTTGEVKISTGDLIFGTAGKGIVLGNTSNVDANTLDDYEEGTHLSVWTASSSGTITPYRAHMAYTKIGNMVHMTGEVEIASVSSPSGSTRFTLPFVIATAGTQRNMNFGGAGFAAYHINFHENNPPVILAHESESFAKLVYQRNDSSFIDYQPAAGDTFFFSFSYKTT